MSEPILMALVQLFAIIAASEKNTSENARKILGSYLGQHLNSRELEEYLKLFDELLLFHQPEEGEAGDEEVLAKTRGICQRIRKQLTALDRHLVFIKFLEFMKELSGRTDGHPDVDEAKHNAYLQIFREAFNPPEQEFSNSVAFIADPLGAGMNPENLLIISGSDPDPGSRIRHIRRDHLDGRIFILYNPSIRTLICRYAGNDILNINGHPILPFRSFVLSNGAILKSPKIAPVYHSDVMAQFLTATTKIQIDFTAREIEYRFPGSTNGIHPFSFTASSGELIGVMGGSGVGKSTLLNVLNGNLKLHSGQILINGHDIALEPEKVRGQIGFVPQDDLLIDELSVYENLHFNARLCFRDYPPAKLRRAVMRVLDDIGLTAIRNLTVGDPLNKFISGGQRKRVNIALELIREPAVLFADEPTSGLSSMDSEMVMLLLKEQTLKGRLVIVNIHQPSSDIFKLFDKIMILDKGGYPIYYGNPIDAVAWFKSAASHANPDESECQSCGYVNPEQLLQIAETRIVNEYGRFTGNRKTTPKEWYELFRETIQPTLSLKKEVRPVPKTHFRIPGVFKQFRIFGMRNLLTRLKNRQYMVINLLEAPLLAALLAFLTRYRAGDSYVFADNRNLVAYLFMSVVVSLFLGMMVSAEEIIKDRRLLKREAFLHLSRFSYLNSKIVFLFTLSAFQSLLYVVTGNLILGIHDMILPFWLILFATSCFANMVGLNISSGLNSVVAIYILIPFILVPQLLLSGTIVPFDFLNPVISSQKNVPLVGDLMTSRWTFEAMAVEQFSNNSYERIFYPYDRRISEYGYQGSHVIPALESQMDECRRNLLQHRNEAKTRNMIAVLNHEVPAITSAAGIPAPPSAGTLDESAMLDTAVVESLRSALQAAGRVFSARLSDVTEKRDAEYARLSKTLGGNDAVFRFRQQHYNDNLADLVMDRSRADKILTGKGELIRKKDPVFMEPLFRNGRAHLYAPVKLVGEWRISTFWFNFTVIWLMSLVLYLTLLHDSLRKLTEVAATIRKKR